MITYVNDVFVSNEAAVIYKGKVSALAKDKKGDIVNVGKIAIVDVDGDADAAIDDVPATANRIKIGLITNKVSTIVAKDGSVKYCPVIDWTNPIDKSAVKSFQLSNYTADTQDKVVVSLVGAGAQFKQKIKSAGHSIVFRIVYKDMNTRFRKWTESYEYITKEDDDEKKVAEGIVKLINKDTKRARVTASLPAAPDGSFTIEAMPYDDDDSVNAISPAATVRFSVAMWIAYNDEAGIAGIGWNHRLPIPGIKITKTPGAIYTASAKYVRDREAAALGYDGILNRGEEDMRRVSLPELNVKLNGKYDAVTLMFENMYHSADDLNRLTKQSVEIYPVSGQGAAIKTALAKFIG